MRKSKLFRILALVIIPVVLAVALGFIIAGNQGKDTDPTVSTTTSSIHVGAPTDPTDPDPSIGSEAPSTPTDPDVPTGSDEIPDDDTGLTPEEPTEPSQTPTEPTKPDNSTPVIPEKPVQPPVDTEDDSVQSGITIGGGTTEYICGTAGHNCDGPETHAYIQNLELKGCPHCGSHSCVSFYAVDEWGNTCYTPSKCPSYDIQKDPVYYCQECGKACGDGTSGTCVQFVAACKCPNCDEAVDSRTCHSCQED